MDCSSGCSLGGPFTPPTKAATGAPIAVASTAAAKSLLVFIDKPPMNSRPAVLSPGVAGEDIVAVFCRLVAGEAGLVKRFVARFAVGEVGEAPAAGRGVL